MNIVENLSIKNEYYFLAKDLCSLILVDGKMALSKPVIAVGGESGSGKSTTAFCLQQELISKGFTCAILHMDSYFILPPKDNHLNRVKSLENVGPHEVNMKLMNEHIMAFKNTEKTIQVPIVNYVENLFTKIELELSEIDILIVEGVYSFFLDQLNHKIFMERTYVDSYENRISRSREKYDAFVEKVLEIEHEILSPMIEDADFVINKKYAIR